MSAPIRVLVVDDHVLFRRGLIGLLSEMPGLDVAGEASNGLDAIRLSADLQPDVILMDVNMPSMGGVDAVTAIRKSGQPVRIIMLTISEKDDDLIGSIMAGADGYLLKSAEPDVLRETIFKVAAGQSVLAPEVTARVLTLVRRTGNLRQAELLSERELQVLRCLAHGLTTSQIATELFISENTVKTHVRHILEKLEVGNRAEAVAAAASLGWLE